MTRGTTRALARSSDVAAEDDVRRDPRLVLAHVREEGPAVDVADRVQPVAVDAGGPQPLVDVDRRPGVRPTESSPRSPVDGRRPTATSSSSPTKARPSSTVTVTGPPGDGPVDRDHLRPGDDDHSVGLQPGAHLLAGEGLLAAEQPVEPLEHGDLVGAEALDGLCHLHADRAAPEGDEPARHLPHRGHVAVVPRRGLGQAGDGRHGGARAGGEDDGAAGLQPGHRTVARRHLDRPARRPAGRRRGPGGRGGPPATAAGRRRATSWWPRPAWRARPARRPGR